MEQIRITKISKVGTSHGIIIPRPVLIALNLFRGDQVSIHVLNDTTFVLHKLSDKEYQALAPLPTIN